MIVDEIKLLVEPVLNSQDAELVDVELKGRKGNHILRIYVDTEDGISLDQCTRISGLISDLLDTKNPIPGKYTLEVSSPGVHRPLMTARDFRRNLGRQVTINYREDGHRYKVEGIIREVGEEKIKVEHKKGIQEIPLSFVELAKIKLRW